MRTSEEGPDEGPPLTQTRTSHAVIEALDVVAMPDVRDEILLAALRDAGMRELPTPDQLADFVEGPLRKAVTASLGEETADTVAESLQPIIRRALLRRSAVQKRSATPQHTPPPPQPQGETFVLIASKDQPVAQALQEHLDGVAVVHAVRDVYSLARAAEVYSTSKPRLVVDCRREVTSEHLRSLARLVPPDAHVVLWGIDAELQRTLEPEHWNAIDWTGTDPECDARDLALLCSAGRSSSTPPERRSLRPAQPGPTEQMSVRSKSGAQRRLSKKTVARMRDGEERAARATPATPPSRDEVTSQADPVAAASSAEPALLVVADQGVRWILEQAVQRLGLRASTVRSAAEALGQLAATAQPPPLVIATLGSNEISPLRFAHAARAVHDAPPKVVLLLGDDDAVAGDLSAVDCVAPRTVSAGQLEQALRALLG